MRALQLLGFVLLDYAAALGFPMLFTAKPLLAIASSVQKRLLAYATLLFPVA